MRDIFFLFIFPLIIYAVLRKPFIGAAMWLWVAMHFPNGWVYSFATSFRYNMIIVLCAAISYIKWKEKEPFKGDGLTFLIFIFLLWTTVTSFYTISIPDFVWAQWLEFLKISLFYFFSIMVIRTRLHMNVLIWALVLSVGFYGCLEGLKYISSGGAHRIRGLASHVLGDRNELALAFNMMLPLLVYLAGISKYKFIRLGLYAAVVLNVIAIIGTFSRGGTIALVIIGAYFWFQSKHKLVYTLLLVIGLSFSSSLLSPEWEGRMNTIETVKTDASFLGRVLAWKQAVLMANDNIITGGGFKAGQVSFIWHSYDAAGSYNEIIDTSHMGGIGYKAAHSIYFQVLGDHGYIGLFIFLMILLVAFNKTGKIVKLAISTEQSESIISLTKMLRVSLVAYCAGGAGVSLAYFDMLYALLALIFALEQLLIKDKSVKSKRRGDAYKIG